MRPRTVLLCLLSIPFFVASGLFLTSTQAPQAGPENTLTVSRSDGYGLSDCLAEGQPCGKLVADAWCEAHGHGTARSFGGLRDTTGFNSAAAPEPAPADLITVECRE
jgi:hypothetical protein